MSFQKSIPCIFSWRSQGPWTPDWLVGPFCYPNATWLLYPKRQSKVKLSQIFWRPIQFRKLQNYTNISDEVIEANMTSGDDVWQMLFDGASRIDPTGKIICWSGGDICLTRELRSSSCILIDRILLQQRSWVQCFAHWPPTRSTNKGTVPWSLWCLQIDHQSSQKRMRSVMKTWYLITMQPLNWPTHLMVSTLAMCLAS